ncbi:MAG: type II toxin-antitoxin system RelE/ParE family toxin [Oscillospiraceae bacterium]|nr:type II toxin-antitoxin system RelE/ParE family toxin [Oscillospiraceae bacterium]
MNEIHLTPEAQDDLREIKGYISGKLENPQAALSTARKITQAIRQLADFAESGAPLSSTADVDEDYRFLISGSYMIFYRVSGSDVYVDRILYSRRDYLHILLGDSAQQDVGE